jgi:hypothetical protein
MYALRCTSVTASTCNHEEVLFCVLGAGLGSGGGFERLHFLLEKAWDSDQISLSFLKVQPVLLAGNNAILLCTCAGHPAFFS